MASNDPVLLKEKKQPVVEKKAGVDTTPQPVDMPKYMKDDFVGTICKNFDMSIDALMELCKKLKDRNEKYCERMGIDVNLFILTALVKGEGGAKTFFSSGAKWGSDSRLNEAKQLYDHYKTLKTEDGSGNVLDRKPRDDLIGGDLSKSIEQRSGTHGNVDTDMALAFITMWNNTRTPFKRKFTDAAEAADWFGKQTRTNPDFFSEFPGGIAGITMDTYNNLANPKAGGNLDIHKEIMGIAKGAQTAAQPQEDKPITQEIDQGKLTERLRKLVEDSLTAQEKRLQAQVEENLKRRIDKIAQTPVTEAKPAQAQKPQDKQKQDAGQGDTQQSKSARAYVVEDLRREETTIRTALKEKLGMTDGQVDALELGFLNIRLEDASTSISNARGLLKLVRRMYESLTAIENAEGGAHKGELVSQLSGMAFDDVIRRLQDLGTMNYKTASKMVEGWVQTDINRRNALVTELGLGKGDVDSLSNAQVLQMSAGLKELKRAEGQEHTGELVEQLKEMSSEGIIKALLDLAPKRNDEQIVLSYTSPGKAQMLSYDEASAIVGTWALQYEAEPKEVQPREQTKSNKKKEKNYSNADEGPVAEAPKAAVAPAQADSSSYKTAVAPAADSSSYKAQVAPAQSDSSSYAGSNVQTVQEPAQQAQTLGSYQELGNSLKASQKELGLTDKQCDDIKKGLELIQGLDSNGEMLVLLNLLNPQKQASKLAYIGQKYGSGDEQLSADRARYFITFGTSMQ